MPATTLRKAAQASSSAIVRIEAAACALESEQRQEITCTVKVDEQILENEI
jgi:hypothetical protein